MKKYTFTLLSLLVISLFLNSSERNNVLHGEITATPPPLSTFELEPFAFSTVDEEYCFGMVKIALAYQENDALEKELKQKKKKIWILINSILKNKSCRQLNSNTEKLELAEEIEKRVNSLLTKGRIREILFKELTAI